MTVPFIRLFAIIISSLPLIACQRPDETTTGLTHDRVQVNAPTPADNAKIVISNEGVTLAKAHVMPIKSELYQPAFRLEGVIIPHQQATITLPKDGKLSQIVEVGKSVQKGETVAHFYQEIIPTQGMAVNEPDLTDTPKTAQTDTTSPAQTDTPKTDTPTNPAQTDTPKTATLIDPAQTNATKRQPFVVITLMGGKVGAVFVHEKDKEYRQGTSIVTVYNDRFIKFISPLPREYAKFLAVGMAVNFDTHDGRTFSGQIEHVIANDALADMTEVHVAITPEEVKKTGLKLGERVGGYVDYGQIEVGVLVPAFAIFDEDLTPLDLSDLTKPPHRPATPKKAWLWEIGQDERLSLLPIKVIKYLPESDQYLIAGVKLDGLIVMANLPKNANGAKVRLK